LSRKSIKVLIEVAQRFLTALHIGSARQQQTGVGRIPDSPLFVEFVQVSATGQTNKYSRFAGTGLVEDHSTTDAVTQQASFVLGLNSARLP
jgi:hypothetical protein